MSFSSWQINIRSLVTHNGLNKTLLKKVKLASTMTKEKMKDLYKRAMATIQLYLSNEILQEVIHEKTFVAL